MDGVDPVWATQNHRSGLVEKEYVIHTPAADLFKLCHHQANLPDRVMIKIGTKRSGYDRALEEARKKYRACRTTSFYAWHPKKKA